MQETIQFDLVRDQVTAKYDNTLPNLCILQTVDEEEWRIPPGSGKTVKKGVEALAKLIESGRDWKVGLQEILDEIDGVVKE